MRSIFAKLREADLTSWTKFYDKEVDAQFYLDNIANHRVFLTSILKEKPLRTLEVGVGTGTFSIFLSQLGIDAHALDNDPAVIEAARENCKKFNGNVHLIKGDAFNLCESVQNTRYNVVFHQGLLEHFSDAEMATLLRQQLEIAPVVVFSVPTPEYGKQDLGNERLLSPSAWLDMLQIYRFHVVEHSSYFEVLRELNPDVLCELKAPATATYVRCDRVAFMAKLMRRSSCLI